MTLPRITVATLFLVCLVSTGSLLAQTPTAVVNGIVVDTTGATVPDAKVTVVNQATNVVSSRNTNSEGAFTIINLLPGNYALTVEKAGFKRTSLAVFKLDVDQTLTEKITLEVGITTETVEVSASSMEVMVQRSSTELGTTMDEEMMHGLPLNGRNFTELMVLQPGVNPLDTSQGNSAGKTGAGGNPDGGNISIPGSIVYKPSVNGAGNRSNAFYMDGIINTDDRGGGWAIPPIADTIQEMKVQSHNNDAQYGNVLGSVVNLVTKSRAPTISTARLGSSRAARSSMRAIRSPASARRHVCPIAGQQAGWRSGGGDADAAGAAAILSGTPVSPLGYSQNEFGGTFGGPIIRNKTFFYVAYEGWQVLVSRITASSSCRVCRNSRATSRGTGVSPELVGAVNATKTAITPNTIYNPFAESGANSAVRFRCDTSGNPMPLLNPGLAFGQPGYGIQAAGGTLRATRFRPASSIRKLVSVITAYTASEYKNCAFTRNLQPLRWTTAWITRNTINNANNFDFRVDHHFSEKNTVFGRAYMMWDTEQRNRRGTRRPPRQAHSTRGTSAAPGTTSSLRT